MPASQISAQVKGLTQAHPELAMALPADKLSHASLEKRPERSHPPGQVASPNQSHFESSGVGCSKLLFAVDQEIKSLLPSPAGSQID